MGKERGMKVMEGKREERVRERARVKNIDRRGETKRVKKLDGERKRREEVTE